MLNHKFGRFAAYFKRQDSPCCGPTSEEDDDFPGFLNCNKFTATACSNADDYVYWDSLHYTQRVQEYLANRLWNGTFGVDCHPFCLQELAALP